ncbi:Plasmodium exported protein, unknown function [Plasmodium gonderi]|uniref:Plasmodium RESA N-terminal domain-containing protein n=1 Tax=Plasmodium gonderi TaxID=77519 RepID=A0A1Y1JGL4_PLAGO|nr:Plasmodium exported protein, unknown function [Plasmodium gonderi]GAW80798.1 Plasmodium exported protein, unknown function [Plasmodium gonderi]
MNIENEKKKFLLSRKKISVPNTIIARENVYNLWHNKENMNVTCNFLIHLLSKRFVMTLGVIICNICTWGNKLCSQLEFMEKYSRNLSNLNKPGNKCMSLFCRGLCDLCIGKPVLTSITAITVKDFNEKTDTINGRVVDIGNLLEKCQDNVELLREDELDIMLYYLEYSEDVCKIDFLSTWWQICRMEKNECDVFKMQLSRLNKEIAKKNGLNTEFGNNLLKNAYDEYENKVKKLQSTYSSTLYDYLNRKEKSPVVCIEMLKKYRTDICNLRDEFWKNSEKHFNEKMKAEKPESETYEE